MEQKETKKIAKAMLNAIYKEANGHLKSACVITIAEPIKKVLDATTEREENSKIYVADFIEELHRTANYLTGYTTQDVLAVLIHIGEVIGIHVTETELGILFRPVIVGRKLKRKVKFDEIIIRDDTTDKADETEKSESDKTSKKNSKGNSDKKDKEEKKSNMVNSKENDNEKNINTSENSNDTNSDVLQEDIEDDSSIVETEGEQNAGN